MISKDVMQLDLESVINWMDSEMPETISDISFGSFNVSVKNRLSAAEAESMINFVVDQSFPDGEFNAFASDTAKISAFIYFYTNLPIAYDDNVLYKMTYMVKNNMDAFKSVIDMRQYYDIYNIIEEYISHICEQNISGAKAEITKAFDKLSAAIDAVNKSFEDFDPKVVEALSKSLSDGKIDEQAMMKAYLDNKPKKRTKKNSTK